MSSSTSTIDARLVQSIARAIIAKLREEDIAGDAPSTTDATTSVLDLRLITVATLERLPAGTSKIVIPPRAVITPAAVDEAKQRGWIVERAAVERSASSVSKLPANNQVAASGLALADADSVPRGSAMGRQLATRGTEVEIRSVAELITAIDAGTVKGGLVLADLPAVVVCQACRQPAIRAAAVATLEEMQRIEAALQPQLWVLDMSRLSLSQAIALADRCGRLVSTGGPH